MTDMETFSRRFGLLRIKEKEIVVREDAPEELRGFVKMVFYELHKNPSDLRAIVCKVLRIPPDSNNWSEYPNIDLEVTTHLERCEWFFVYDIIEAIIHKIAPEENETFSKEINDYFLSHGIGWKIVGGQIETRLTHIAAINS